MWIANFLEENGSKITQFGLLQLFDRISEIMRIHKQYCNYNELITKKEQMILQLNSEQKKIYQTIINHVSKDMPLTIFINGHAGRATLNYDGGRTAHSLFRIPVEQNDDVYKCNIEAVDLLLREICNQDIPFSGKVFIGIGDFRQVAPIVLHAGKTATILESIKSSLIWKTFKIYDLQQPIHDALDPEYSKLMDNIRDRINGENVSLELLNTTHKLDEIIEFVFPKNVLNNPISNIINLYSADSLADNETSTNYDNYAIQRNMITIEL
ncbi:5461_t:CDS:2 [Cetraspora pellucida]|uniref:5461_t:CDS:1 n=1 Tax=Cetraspora pellucida TaxID=1433469 RepID=A0ACA9NTG5_9GLOM|nr:5461_t:CDS:2 [Cetraspora pellucida]